MIGMPAAITVGLVMTTLDCMIPLGGIIGPVVEYCNSPFAETQETGQTLVKVAAPCAVVTQMDWPIPTSLVALVGTE
jgi:hypothetical protein